MLNNDLKKRIKKIKIVVVMLFLLLIIRLGFIINDAKIASAVSSNYTQEKNISNENYKFLDINNSDLTEYDIKFILTVDSQAFCLNNETENAKELLTFYYIMKTEDENFSFYDITKSSGEIKYEISENAYNEISNTLKELKGIYTYKYYLLEMKMKKMQTL